MKLSHLAIASLVLALSSSSLAGCAGIDETAISDDAANDDLTASQLTPAQLQTRFKKIDAFTASPALVAKTMSGAWLPAANGGDSSVKIGEANSSGAFDVEYSMVLPDIKAQEALYGTGASAGTYSPEFYNALKALDGERMNESVQSVAGGFRMLLKGRAKIVQAKKGEFYALSIEYLSPLIKPSAFDIATKNLLVQFDTSTTFDRKVFKCLESKTDSAGTQCIRESTEATLLRGSGTITLLIGTDIKGNTVKANISNRMDQNVFVPR
jgi:hypothetical protein